MNRPEPSLTPAALAQLAAYNWPGNVRQLQNVIERSIIMWQEGHSRSPRGSATKSGAEMKTHFSPRLVLPVTERDHARGPVNAPVTLVEYGDYQRPYCGAAKPTVDQVQRELVGRRLSRVLQIAGTCAVEAISLKVLENEQNPRLLGG